MHSLMHNCTQLTATTGGVGRGAMEQAEMEIALMAMLEIANHSGWGYNNLPKKQKKRNKGKTTKQLRSRYRYNVWLCNRYKYLSNTKYLCLQRRGYSNRALSKYSNWSSTWLASPRLDSHSYFCSDFLFMSPQNATRERFSSSQATDHVVCLNF